MKNRGNPLLKKIDRYAGIPLTYLLGSAHKKQPMPIIKDRLLPVQFLIIKTAAIGDTILTEPMLRELLNCYPKAQITYVCTKTNKAMVEMLPGITKIYVFSLSNPVRSLQVVANLGEFDFLLDFTPWDKLDSVIAHFAHAKYKVGFKRKDMYRHYVYDKAVEHKDDRHEIDNYRALLKAIAIQPQGYTPVINSEVDLPVAAEAAKPYVVFHLFPGGSSATLRSWETDKWLESGKRCFMQYGYTIIITGGKEDAMTAKQVVQQFKKLGVAAISVAGSISLGELAVLLQQAIMLVTVNTGVMHLGAAVDIPLVALHGATDYKRWGPVSNRSVVVQSDESCQPCLSLGFESKCTNPVCMQHITVEMVWQVITKILGRQSLR